MKQSHSKYSNSYEDTDAYQKHYYPCSHPSPPLLRPLQAVSNCSAYTENLGSAEKAERLHHASQQTAKNFPDCPLFPSTRAPRAPNPFRHIHNHRDEKWPAGQTVAESTHLPPGFCDSLGKQYLQPTKLGTTICPCVTKRDVAICLHLPSSIHPLYTHFLEHTTVRKMRIALWPYHAVNAGAN